MPLRNHFIDGQTETQRRKVTYPRPLFQCSHANGVIYVPRVPSSFCLPKITLSFRSQSSSSSTYAEMAAEMLSPFRNWSGPCALVVVSSSLVPNTCFCRLEPLFLFPTLPVACNPLPTLRRSVNPILIAPQSRSNAKLLGKRLRKFGANITVTEHLLCSSS